MSDITINTGDLGLDDTDVSDEAWEDSARAEVPTDTDTDTGDQDTDDGHTTVIGDSEAATQDDASDADGDTAAEQAAPKLGGRNSPGRPRKSTLAKPGAAKVTKGKPAKVGAKKKTAGKTTAVAGVAAGATLTRDQQAKVNKIKKLSGEIDNLEVQRSDRMWEIASIIDELVTPKDEGVAPVKQKELAKAADINPTNISIWQKTWRLFGAKENRVIRNGIEASFNDHVERARMLRPDGTPDPQQAETFKKIEELAEKDNTTFAVAKRNVRTGPAPSKLDLGGVRDRCDQMYAKLLELATDDPNDAAMGIALSVLTGALDTVQIVAKRMEAHGYSFDQTTRSTVDSLEAQLSGISQLMTSQP